MSDLQSATITIDSIEQKDNRFKIKATSGGTYSFFMMKKDGTESNAYQQMQTMGIKGGDTVDIAYSTSQGDYQGKAITYKNIVAFREASVGQQAITVGQTTQSSGYDQDGAKKGMAVNCGHDAWIAGKVDDWKEHAREVFKFDPSVDEANPDEISVEDLPF